MKIDDAFNALTRQAKRQALIDLEALLRVRGKTVAHGYLKKVLYGHGVCSDDLARIICGYFRGVIGLDVSLADIRGEAGTVADAANRRHADT